LHGISWYFTIFPWICIKIDGFCWFWHPSLVGRVDNGLWFWTRWLALFEL
jgi:hypothetical protein